MAEETINQQTEDTTPTSDDYVLTWDVTPGTTKKVSLANIKAKIAQYNPYKFAAYHTSPQTVGTSDTKITLGFEEYDTNSNFDSASTYLYTVPVTGFYTFTGLVTWSANGTATAYIPSLYKNGVMVKRGTDIRGTNIVGACNVVADLQLTAGDTIGLYFGTGGHSVATNAAQNQVYLMGRLTSLT